MSNHSSKKRATFVSFSGVDGAGKSTQINALRTYMEQQGLKVHTIAFWDNIARLTGLREGAGHKIFKGDKGIGSPDRPINRRDKNVRSFPMSCARLVFYSIDAVSTRMAVKKALRSGADFVIFDRYIYDQMANLNVRNPFVRAYVHLIMKVVPRPDVSYLLDADPIQARARKPEYPLDFIYINRQSYFDLCKVVGQMTVISPAPVAEVQREVLRHALNALPATVLSGVDREPGMSLQSAG